MHKTKLHIKGITVVWGLCKILIVLCDCLFLLFFVFCILFVVVFVFVFLLV